MNTLYEEITVKTLLESIEMRQIEADFHTDKESTVDPYVIATGAMSILGGLGAANPVWAGAMAIGGGASIIADNSGKDDKPPGSGDPDADGAGQMGQRLKKFFTDLEDYLKNTVGGVFGIPQYKVEDIPGSIQKQDFNNAPVRALADGRWIKGPITDGLDTLARKMFDRLVSSPVPQSRLLNPVF